MRKGRSAGGALLVIAFATRAVRAEDKAAIAFHDAEELVKQGKWAEACPLYEASYRADTQLGALLHLADCHEHIGKLASAWAEFTDAADFAHAHSDNREAVARRRADALAPKLAHLVVVAPPSIIEGLVVERDGIAITSMLGTERPIDPGEHDIHASAPGYTDWRTRVVIEEGAKSKRVEIPALEKAPPPQDASQPGSKPPEQKPTALGVSSRDDAQIFIDDKLAGTGHTDGPIAPGRHALRVVAPHMLTYRTEVVVLDGEHRSVEVALEPEPVVTAPGPAPVAPTPPRAAPREIGLGFALGQIRNADRPSAIAYRLDYDVMRNSFFGVGVVIEYGSMSASGTCGTRLPGSAPDSPFDFGGHERFERCSNVLGGLQFLFHLRHAARIDPTLALIPAFNLALVKTTPYDALQMPSGDSTTNVLPAFVIGARAGVDIHPSASVNGWAIGPFFELQYVPIAKDKIDNVGSNTTSYMSWFTGLRTGYTY